MPIRVMIVDDHALVREGTCRLLRDIEDIEVIAEVSRGDEAAAWVERVRPDVVVMDIQLPGMNGIEATREITRRFPGTRVLILSAYGDEDYAQAALSGGATGYLLKTAPMSEVVEAIRGVYAGSTTVDRSVALRFIHRRGHGSRGMDLTQREREVLALLGKGLSNKAIAKSLQISPRTVEGHIHRLFEKQDVGSRTELLRHALEHHLLSIATPE